MGSKTDIPTLMSAFPLITSGGRGKAAVNRSRRLRPRLTQSGHFYPLIYCAFPTIRRPYPGPLISQPESLVRRKCATPFPQLMTLSTGNVGYATMPHDELLDMDIAKQIYDAALDLPARPLMSIPCKADNAPTW